MIISGIYAIANIVNRKVYIGSTNNLDKRWADHLWALRRSKHPNPHLQSSWNKHGEDNFKFMICEYVDDSEQLINREQYWLDFHRMYADVYNIALVAGASMRGRKHTEESKRQMSKSARNRPPMSEERKRKIGQFHKGKVISEETRQKSSRITKAAWARGAYDSDEIRRNMSDAAKGKPNSEEHNRSISMGIHNMSPKAKAEKSRKQSRALGGRKLSEEHKRNIGKANSVKRGYKQSEEHKRKISEGVRRYYRDIKEGG